MGQIVPFYAADQGIVDTLCDIIRKLNDMLENDEVGVDLTPKQLEIFERIVKS